MNFVVWHMDNWTSRPQDQWPRLTGLANRDRSSVEEAQMSTYESPYTADNPASFYHYSLHPDDLATRRSISVYSLKDPDRKKKGSRFPQCRVCFATMLLISLGVAIAVAVTLAIMLSNPHPKFYRTKSTDNTTLSKDFLKEKEVDFGSDICQLMSAMFDLRDSTHQSRKVTDCNVFLADSPGNMVIKLKLNVDETFIKSDSNKVKAMLVANAFVLSSNSSAEKLVLPVPSNTTDKSPTTSDALTSTTRGSEVIPSTTVHDALTLSTVRSDALTSSEGSNALSSSATGSDVGITSMVSDVFTPSSTEPDVFTSSATESDVTSSATESDVFTTSTSESDVFTRSTAGSTYLKASSTMSDYLTSSSTRFDNLSSSSTMSDYLSSSSTMSDNLSSSSTRSDYLSSSSMVSDYLTQSSTESDFRTTSTRFDDITPSTIGLSEFLSQSTSVTTSSSLQSVSIAISASSVLPDERDGVLRASVRSVSSSGSVSLNDKSLASVNTVSVKDNLQFSKSDVTPKLSLSVATRISPSATLSNDYDKLTFTNENLSSSMSSSFGQKSLDKSELVRSVATSVLSSASILSTVSVSDLYITPTATIQQRSSVAMSSHPGYSTGYNRHVTSSVISSEYDSYKDTPSDASVTTVSLYASDMSITQSGDFLSSRTSSKASDTKIIQSELSTTSVTPGLELNDIAKMSKSPQDVSSSELTSINDLQSSLSGVSFSSAVNSLQAHSVASQQVTPSDIESSSVSVVASYRSTYLPDSGSTPASTISDGSIVRTEIPTQELQPSIVVDSTGMTTLESDNASQRMTVSASITVPALHAPKARWLDTTMMMSEVTVDNNSSSIAKLPMLNNDTDSSSNITVPELEKSVTLETRTSQATVPKLGNRTNFMEDNVTVPDLITNLTLENRTSQAMLPALGNRTDVNNKTVPDLITNVALENRTSQTIHPALGNITVPDLITNVALENRTSQTMLPELGNITVPDLITNVALENRTSQTMLPALGNITVPDLITNVALENRTSQTILPRTENRTDIMEDNIKPVTVPLLQPEVRTPLLSTTQTPTTTTQDIGRAIFESDISNRAMGTANPQDFWDNILKMVKYTSTKKPKIDNSELSTLRENISSDSKTFSTVNEGISPSYDSVTLSSLLMVSDTVSMTSTSSYKTTSSSVTKLNDSTSSSANSLKPSEGDILETRPSSLFATEISARSTSFPSIKATPVLTAEPGLMTSIEPRVMTNKHIMTNSTTSIGNGKSLLSSDKANPIGDTLLTTTQDTSAVLFSTAQTASPLNPMVSLTEDYAFYDLIPDSLVTSPPGSTSGFSGSIVTSSYIYSKSSQQLLTDDIEFYDLIPVSKISSPVEISSSKIESTTITDNPISTSTDLSSRFLRTAIQSAHTVEASLTASIEAPATPSKNYLSPSKSLAAIPSVSLEKSVTLTVEASVTQDKTASATPTLNVRPSSIMTISTSTEDVRPSSGLESSSVDFDSSALYATESSGLDIAIRTSASAITSTPIEDMSSLATSVSGTSSSTVVQKSSSEIKATSSLRNTIASTTTEPPPSKPAVFDVGSEFGNKLFFANDFSKMDFTKTEITSNDKSVPSPLFNTVPIIPRVTTPSVPRVRVPDLFQGETNPFQTVPTTPQPSVTTPKIISPKSNDQKASSSSSGQFLFNFDGLGSNFGSSFGLGNISFN